MDTVRRPSIPATDASDDNLSASKNEAPENISIYEQSPDKFFNLYMKALSWPTEGRGLLHVQSPLTYNKEFKVRAASGVYYLSRDENEMFLDRAAPSPDASKNIVVVAKLTVSSTGVVIESVDCPSNSDSHLISQSEMWKEVPKDAEGALVQIGNVLRFGSYKVKIIDLALTYAELENGANVRDLGLLKPFVFSDTTSEFSASGSSEFSATGPICRICFEAGEDDNALVSPCVCAGSLRYIHLNCLRRWLNGQLQVKEFENGGGSYYIRAIKCEICKSVYSRKIYQSILISRPKVPHVIIEDFITGADASSRMHIIPVGPGHPIRVGRSKENDLVLSDISVSRMHAILTLGPLGLVVCDFNSKFGSLVQLPQTIFYPVNAEPLRVQIGSAFVELVAAHPNRIEKLVPERFLQDRGIVRLVKSKTPSDKLLESERQRRNRSSLPPSTDGSPQANPTSPAGTLNTSYGRAISPEIDEIEQFESPVNRSHGASS